MVQLHESGEDFIQYIKSKKLTQLNFTRSNAQLKIPVIELQKSHFMDGLKGSSIVESQNERSDSAEKNKHKLSEKEEDLYRLLQDKYNQIQIRLQELVNQRYGIKEIEHLNGQIHVSRMQKI